MSPPHSAVSTSTAAHTQSNDAVSSLANGRHGALQFWSGNPFEFKHILAAFPPPPQQLLRGELDFPTRVQPGFEELVPCVVAVHGSWGWGPHHLQHLANLRRHGFATFRVDAFSSRGVANTSERQLAVTMANMQYDTYAALNLVVTHPRIDANRVGIVGWSLGGGCAVYNALDPVASRLGGPEGHRFAAHLGFYPAAHYRPRGPWKWTRAPIAVFQGALDDYSPTFMAEDLVKLAKSQGARIVMRLYPDSHHSFDRGESMAVEYLPKVSAPNGTLDLQFPSGILHVTSEPWGTSFATEYEERRKNGHKYCHRGAHAGGHKEQAAAAFQDTVHFFRATLMGDLVFDDGLLPLQVATEVTCVAKENRSNL